jgi:hypothetical protein
MSNISPQVQAVLDRFARQPGVTPEQVTNLQATIDSSPPLVKQLNAAVQDGHLKGFQLLQGGTNAGGEFDPASQTIRLPPGMLTTQQKRPFNMAESAFVLGHELQHAFNRLDVAKADITFRNDVLAKAKDKSPANDYTPDIDARLAASRRDEARAEIAGWNALVGQIRAAIPNATLGDVYKKNNARMSDFIDESSGSPPTHTLKPNLTLNADMSMSDTPANIEAMGQNYFDKAPEMAGIGYRGTSDYVNYYAAAAISYAARVDSTYAKPRNGVEPRMIVDMNRLGLSEKLLEENGLFLGRGSPAPKPYLDSSQTPHTPRAFDHTHQSHTHTPVAPSGGARTPADPEHPDHAMLEQIRSHIRELDRKHGRTFDETSERISHSLLTLAKDERFKRVDHVLLSESVPPGAHLFIVQGSLSDPAHLRTVMKTETAAQTPVAESNVQLEQVNQRLAQEQTQAQQLAQQRAEEAPGSPAMRL